MLIYKHPSFTIYFGASDDLLFPAQYLLGEKTNSLITEHPYSKLASLMPIKAVTFLQQNHTVDGIVITHEQQKIKTAFSEQGDFLITADVALGIGVMTADCLPIIYYDAEHAVVAIAHAGWKGSVNGISGQVINILQKNYNTDIKKLIIIFGPSAKSCCYTVSSEFKEHIQEPFKKLVFREFDKQVYFDLPLFNRFYLENLGIPETAFNVDFNYCTICTPSFYSYRRQKEKAGRQMTVVCLLD